MKKILNWNDLQIAVLDLSHPVFWSEGYPDW